MSAPDRVGALCKMSCYQGSRIKVCVFNNIHRSNSPRRGAVGGRHFCKMPKGELFGGSLTPPGEKHGHDFGPCFVL
jgi:hypothetical protein